MTIVVSISSIPVNIGLARRTYTNRGGQTCGTRLEQLERVERIVASLQVFNLSLAIATQFHRLLIRETQPMVDEAVRVL